MLYDPKWEVKVEPKLEPWRQLLLDAADYMEAHGHAKSTVLNAFGGVCLIGALSMAATGSPYKFVDEYLKRSSKFGENSPMIQAFIEMQKRVGYPVEWNNDYGRSGEEVVAGMRDCANNG